MADRIKSLFFNLESVIQMSVRTLWGDSPMSDLISPADRAFCYGEEKTVFEIHGVQAKDFEFCRSFCSQHDYGYKYKMSGKQFVAVLRPREKAEALHEEEFPV